MGAAWKTSLKSFGQDAFPPEVKMVDGRAHLANNRWTCHEREAIMLADDVCQGYMTITVVLLHKGVRDIR